MPETPSLVKAQLIELWPAPDPQKLEKRNKDRGKPHVVPVQFNPETLRVTFANQSAGGDQPKGSPKQFVGKSTTKLSAELYFDVTQPLPEGSVNPKGDVRRLTKEVAYFLFPQELKAKGKKSKKKTSAPPAVRFLWGSFQFDGVMDSMDETLEFFSEKGVPLRSRVGFSLSQQELQIQFATPSADAAGMNEGPGTQPQHVAKGGEPFQQAAAISGQKDWQRGARASHIEAPRHVPDGTPTTISP